MCQKELCRNKMFLNKMCQKDVTMKYLSKKVVFDKDVSKKDQFEKDVLERYVFQKDISEKAGFPVPSHITAYGEGIQQQILLQFFPESDNTLKGRDGNECQHDINNIYNIYIV